MKRIEIDNTVIDVPESWDDIKLGDYETWYSDSPSNAHERIELIAKICKVDSSVLGSKPIGVFNLIADTLAFAFQPTEIPNSPTIEIEGTTYIVPIAEELTLAAWVDLDEAQKSGEALLSNVLAITCRPNGEIYDTAKTEERQKMFAALSVKEVLPVLGFFLHYKIAYEKRTAMFSEVVQAANQFVNDTGTFPRVGGGIRLFTIWRAVRYRITVVYLRYQLRKFLTTYGLNSKDTEPTKPKKNF